jgi:hypothetical protein
VLLDAYFDNQELNNPRSNLRTVEYLTSMAQAHELVLQAQQHNLIASAKILWHIQAYSPGRSPCLPELRTVTPGSDDNKRVTGTIV